MGVSGAAWALRKCAIDPSFFREGKELYTFGGITGGMEANEDGWEITVLLEGFIL